MQNKFVFFGTPHFAASLLEYLIQENFHPIAVVTQPDRARGRFQNLSFSDVKNTATLLAPDIVEALLDGKQQHLQLSDLLQPIALIWTEQWDKLQKPMTD